MYLVYFLILDYSFASVGGFVSVAVDLCIILSVGVQVYFSLSELSFCLFKSKQKKKSSKNICERTVILGIKYCLHLLIYQG